MNFTFDRLFNLAGVIVVLAIITTLVSHTETKKIIGQIGTTFTGSIRAAMGR